MDLPIKVMTFGSAKGFLRNKQKLLKLQVEMNDPDNTESDKAMAEFILMYTVFPLEREKALDIILDLSQEELNQAVAQITGQTEIPKVSGEKSADGTLQESEPLPSG